jgi:hypothetical protein
VPEPQVGKGILAVYQKHALLPERRDAFDRLGAYLDRQLNPAENVIEMRRA